MIFFFNATSSVAINRQLTRVLVKFSQFAISSIYREKGRFRATINPQKVILDEGGIGLIFSIEEGPRTEIKSINFIGNKKFSDARLIWGGNNSINQIRNFKLKERSIDLAFSDRFSYCVLDGKKISGLNTFKMNRLIENFYNDTFLMDQNACSSPHLIVWVNDKSHKGRNIFWEKNIFFFQCFTYMF